jgi:hypothetical protein
MPDEIGELSPEDDAELTAARQSALRESPSTDAEDAELERDCEAARRYRLKLEAAREKGEE